MTRAGGATLTERAGFVLAGLACIYAGLVPVSLSADRWSGPDLLYCLAVATVLRRPGAAPLGAVLALGLLADLLLLRPLGLGALALVLVTELARRRGSIFRAGGFALEWLAVAAAHAALLAALWGLLVVALAPLPGLAPLMQSAISTALAYPVAVLVAGRIAARRPVRARG